MRFEEYTLRMGVVLALIDLKKLENEKLVFCLCSTPRVEEGS